jgi:hypothetical protein
MSPPASRVRRDVGVDNGRFAVETRAGAPRSVAGMVSGFSLSQSGGEVLGIAGDRAIAGDCWGWGPHANMLPAHIRVAGNRWGSGPHQ